MKSDAELRKDVLRELAAAAAAPGVVPVDGHLVVSP